MKRMILSAIMAIFAAGFLVIVAQAESSDKCISGYVWREAFPGDHVCVTPATRNQADYDNRHASERIDENAPGGALYGGNTCLPGYVWREARPSDLVCVTPETRTQTKYDNSQAADRSYINDSWIWRKPRWFDYRLDWCLNWGTNCGQPAADYFCMRQQYTAALEFAAAPNIGASEPTMVISGRKVCDQSTCTGFKYITCYGQIPLSRIYKNPEWQGERLDACFTWDTGCGRRAANAYCRAKDPEKGFTKSFFYTLDAQPGDVDTLTIGTNEICDANRNNCTGFQLIICQ
jgi:hypothetical protein